MARRGYDYSAVCAHKGCAERGYFHAETRREQMDHRRQLQERPWRCARHNRPGVVLSVDEPVKERTLESYETDFGIPSPHRPPHKFWTELEHVAEKKGGNGFVYGPGFKAFAEDFPPGTRLVVTARVEIPAASREERQDG